MASGGEPSGDGFGNTFFNSRLNPPDAEMRNAMTATIIEIKQSIPGS